MEAAVRSGDAKKLAELIRQDPGFNVNMDLAYGWTFLHYACRKDSGSAVIPVLLAHPDRCQCEDYKWTHSLLLGLRGWIHLLCS